MELRKDKSANQLYKEEKKDGRTTLDFKSWLQMKKSQNFSNLTGDGSIPVNAALNDPIQNLLNQIHQEGGQQNTAGTTYTFGVSNKVWIWGGVGIGLIVIGTIVYHHYRKSK